MALTISFSLDISTDKKKVSQRHRREVIKDRTQMQTATLKTHMVAGSFYVAKPKKGRPSGDDAHFVCHQTQSIGVADGVGGSAKEGVDPGKYARKLMQKSKASIFKEMVRRKHVSPENVLKEAYENTKLKGKSTVCIIAHNGSKSRLSFANIGDSGFMVLRNKKCVYVSSKQQHYFNCPFSLKGGDQPNSEEINKLVSVGEMEVEKGDVVVAGTDGLFDNMYVHDIEELFRDQVGDVRDGCDAPDIVAWLIGMKALANSKKDYFRSPFAMAAKDAGVEFYGGKPDDITVIVAYII